MEGSASPERDGTRGILDPLQVGRDRRADPPYDQGGMKYAQAVITQNKDGSWYLFIQSDRQVEMSLTGSIEDIVKELKFAATREWTRREKI
jgi:hypothetical protein